MKNIASAGGGSPAPDFDGHDTNGIPVRLSQFWAAGPVVVVFLRHLGCTFCRTHVVELRRQYAEFKALGADVIVVSMGTPPVGKAFQILFDLPFPMLMTGEGETAPYEQYGLGKGSLGQLLGWRSWIGGFRAIPVLGRRIVGMLQGDGAQLAGTFIIDRSGTIRFAYRSKGAADNPPNRVLLDALAELHKGGNTLDDIDTERAAATAS